MALIRGGRAFYGQPIGILMADAVVPRPPGDIGNAFTFDFPVRYRLVPGATWDRFASADPTLLDPFLEGARALEAEGIAITASCTGSPRSSRRKLASAVSVPVFASSLVQVPLVRRMLRADQQVGILTAHAGHLTERHLEACGIADEPVVLWGSEHTRRFTGRSSPTRIGSTGTRRVPAWCEWSATSWARTRGSGPSCARGRTSPSSGRPCSGRLDCRFSTS